MNISFYNSDQIEGLLRDLTPLQDSIEQASEIFLRLGKDGFHQKLAEDWYSQYHLYSNPEHYEKRLAFLYLCNDIIQKCKSTVPLYIQDFKPYLIDIFESIVRSRDNILKDALALVRIWKERKIYPSETIHEMLKILSSTPSVDKDDVQYPELPEGLIKVPQELLAFVDGALELQKWHEKTIEAESKVKGAFQEPHFNEDVASLHLAEYKRCLELEQKYRANLLRAKVSMMRQLEADHISYVHALKKVNILLEDVKQLLQK